jgi:enamine deaminase RidA (YjgF/YER057c/UK114 family)
MTTTPVNPWPWSLEYGYSQALLVERGDRVLYCAGQTAMDAQGAPQHAGDMRGQMALALENLGSVLGAAGMGFGHVVRLVVYATDVDEAMRCLDLLGARFGPVGVRPAMTLVGVTRLALPSLMVELEATAVG